MRELERVRAALAAARAQREGVVLATVMHVQGSVYRGAGARMVIHADGRTVGAVSGGCLEADLIARAPQVLAAGVPEVVQYDTRTGDDVLLGLGLGCQGIVDLLLEPLRGEALARAEAFYTRLARHRDAVLVQTVLQEHPELPLGSRVVVDARGAVLEGDPRCLAAGVVTAGERVVPAVPLLICGAGNDAVPVARLAALVGHHVTVVDHRPAFVTRERFPDADVLVPCDVTASDEALADHVLLDSRSCAVVMAHSAPHDRAALRALLAAGARYVGVLGPRRRTGELVGLAENEWPPSLFAPVGLDLGAESPEEIALAILAELAAVVRERAGRSLREHRGPLHADRGSAPPTATAVLPTMRHPMR